MIYVGGVPVSTASSSSDEGRNMLDVLMEHPILVSAANSFRNLPERKVSEEFAPETSTQSNIVYVFQREYATVSAKNVDFVGTDEATTCVGIVIRNRETEMTSIAHMDSPKIVDFGLTQMLSLVSQNDADVLDVHLIGAFEDSSPDPAVTVEFSRPLCLDIVEALLKLPQMFHLQTLFVLRHNTIRDSEGNAHPIFKGFLLKTLTGSIIPASFDRSSRCPDEIIRRIRVTACSESPRWNGKLLDTYNTQTDRFVIAPCSWTTRQLNIAKALQGFSDSEILHLCSTSPLDENPDFVENQTRIWKYIIEYPHWRDAFPMNRPRVFERSASGWVKL